MIAAGHAVSVSSCVAASLITQPCIAPPTSKAAPMSRKTGSSLRSCQGRGGSEACGRDMRSSRSRVMPAICGSCSTWDCRLPSRVFGLTRSRIQRSRYGCAVLHRSSSGYS
ncbi:hypothetical protein APX70_06607 [Pseudomonas syringae pv. maculicola]|uniref:Uncharacterized protein n=1 Tax=Pseudomonas syringae pv. maculicola TaxID=59511 RepID=A0A3M3BC35_PSEYM|nr:hypothetical protein APX70_06607 [Pseudomonas syringae pv. maculicola]